MRNRFQIALSTQYHAHKCQYFCSQFAQAQAHTHTMLQCIVQCACIRTESNHINRKQTLMRQHIRATTCWRTRRLRRDWQHRRHCAHARTPSMQTRQTMKLFIFVFQCSGTRDIYALFAKWACLLSATLDVLLLTLYKICTFTCL